MVIERVVTGNDLEHEDTIFHRPVIGDTVSIVHARGTTLWLLTRPMVGRMPTMPLTEEGRRMEPPVSVPSAPRQVRAATAAPDPPLDPAGKRSGFQGLRQVP